MTESITNKILKSYGYKGAQAEFKSVIYPITQLRNNIEDHKLNQISPELQQILESEQARQMVQERGITLERTKEFFSEKINEYNSIIDLKHLRTGISYTTPKKDNVFKRHTADQGKITNYHLTLNWQNLNLVFNEIENTTNCRTTSLFQTPVSQPNKKNDHQSNMIRKDGLVSRLDKKLNDYDTKQSLSLTTQVPTSRKYSQIQDGTPLLGLNRRNSVNYGARRPSRINNFMKTVSLAKQKKIETQEFKGKKRQDMIRNYITNSFQQQRENTEESVKERAKSQHDNRKKYDADIKELNSMNKTIEIEDCKNILEQNLDQVSAYQNIETKNINYEELKKRKERRNQIEQSVNERYQPKYVHLAGSKFALKNTFKNQEIYRNTMNKILEVQLNDELKKLHNLDDGIDLDVLEGPPRKIDYHSTNLAQDYNDVKVSKIVQKMKR